MIAPFLSDSFFLFFFCFSLVFLLFSFWFLVFFNSLGSLDLEPSVTSLFLFLLLWWHGSDSLRSLAGAICRFTLDRDQDLPFLSFFFPFWSTPPLLSFNSTLRHWQYFCQALTWASSLSPQILKRRGSWNLQSYPVARKHNGSSPSASPFLEITQHEPSLANLCAVLVTGCVLAIALIFWGRVLSSVTTRCLCLLSGPDEPPHQDVHELCVKGTPGFQINPDRFAPSWVCGGRSQSAQLREWRPKGAHFPHTCTAQHDSAGDSIFSLSVNDSLRDMQPGT